MKKKPELFKRTGKSSLTLRNFLNNLKENDLHYENKQITQCVFLGVLRLKPVPSIFTSNSVPSVSAQDNENTAKKGKSEVKASNVKKTNKNVPKRNDINKVLSGAVAKRNPQKVKAAVKKAPVKKSNIIKIKLNTKKKVVKDKGSMSSSNNEPEASGLPPDSSATVAPNAFISGPTLSLTPIMSPTKFNPVQNLFDKLKQKIDENNSEPSSLKAKKQVCKSKEIPDSNIITSKVCKINAKRSVKVVPLKKSKQVLHKKPGTHEQLTPGDAPSPITISDTESISKKDDDDITEITDESNSSSSVNQEADQQIVMTDAPMEDVIFISQQAKQKNKARTSPRNKVLNSAEFTDKQNVIATGEADHSAETNFYSSPASYGNLNKSIKEKSSESCQSNEIIVISDELGTRENKNASNNSENSNEENQNPINNENPSRNDVIIIDEVTDLRVSPRHKRMDEAKIKNKNDAKHSRQGVQAESNDVIVINEETAAPTMVNANSSDQLQNMSENISEEAHSHESTTQEVNIAINNDQESKNKNKSYPKLLKIVDKNEKISITIKKELIESASDEQDVIVINEKPKPRKSRPPLLPPVLLTPMLLRSELAQKKSNGTTNQDLKSKSNKRTRPMRSNVGHNINNTETQLRKNRKALSKSSTRLLRPEMNNSGNIGSPDKTETIQQNSSEDFSRNSKSNNTNTLHLSESVMELHNANVSHVTENLSLVSGTSEKSDLKNEVYVEETHNTMSNLRSDLPSHQVDKSETSHIDDLETEKIKNSDVLILNEDNKLNITISPRLLRSDVAKQKNQENVSLNNFKDDLDQFIKNEKEDTHIENVELSLSPNKHSKKSARQENQEVIHIKEETTSEDISLRSSELHQQKKQDVSKKINIHDRTDMANEIPLQGARTSPRLRSEVSQNKSRSPQTSDQNNLDEIVVVNESTTKKRDRSNGTLRSEVAHQKPKEKTLPTVEVEKVVVLIHDEPKSKEKHSSTLRAHECVSESVGESSSSIQEKISQVKTNKNGKSSPRSPRREKTQRRTQENLIQEVHSIKDDFQESRVVKHTTCSRLLRSEIVSQQTVQSISPNPHIMIGEKSENRNTSSRLLRSEMALDRGVQDITRSSLNNTLEERNEKSRVLRSEIVSLQNNPKQDQSSNSIKMLTDSSKKQILNSRLPEMETTAASKDLSKELNENIVVIEDDNIEQPSSSRLLRSEVCQQSKPLSLPKKQSNGPGENDDAKDEKMITSRLQGSELRNISKSVYKDLYATDEVVFSKPKENSACRRRRSLLMDLKLKQKTPMLLRSELAQIKSFGSDAIIERTASEHEFSLDKREGTAKTEELIKEVSIMTVGTSKQILDMKDVRPAKRKSLIDDLKRKRAATEETSTSVTLKNTIIEPLELSTGVLEISDEDYDVQCTSEKIAHNSVPDENKDNGTAKHKISPRSTKLRNNNNEVFTNDVNCVSEEAKVEINEVLLPSHDVSSISPKNDKHCELDEEKRKQSSSPKRKSKEATDDKRIKMLPMLPEDNHSDISSPKESKLLNSKKLHPKEKSLSPKTKVATRNNGPKEVMEETDKKPLCRQRSSASKQNLKDGMNNEESNSPRGTSQELSISVLPTEESTLEIIDVSPKRRSVSPKRKLNDVKHSEITYISEKAEEKLSEGLTITEKPKDITSNKKSPTRNKKTLKATDENNPSYKDNISTESPKVAKTGRNKNQPSKQRKKNKKITFKINKAKAETKSVPKVTIKPSIDEVISTAIDNMPSKKKKNTAPRKLKQPKICKQTEDVEELPEVKTADNINSFPSEADKSKTRGKQTKASPTKRKLKNVINEEQIVGAENMPQVESSVSNTEVKLEINDVKPPKQKRGNVSKKKPSKNKKQCVTVDSLNVPENVDEQTVTNTSKKVDTTIFDFDESEPEVMPLRLSNTPRKDKLNKPTIEDSEESNVNVSPTAKRQKLNKNNNKSKTKAQAKAKAKLLDMFNDKSIPINNLENLGSTQNTPDQNITYDRQNLNEIFSTSDAGRNNVNTSLEKVTFAAKTSPLKQTTIIDMFNKVFVKKEKSSVTEIFERSAKETAKGTAPEKSTTENSDGNMITNMPPPKFERKFLAPGRDEGEENEYYDDDSDSESRMEWMPEEYAEYKFKYSAKKMLSYKPIHKCKICLLILPSYYKLSKHKLEHAKTENPYNCTQCDQAFPSIDDLTAHLRLHKDGASTISL